MIAGFDPEPMADGLCPGSGPGVPSHRPHQFIRGPEGPNEDISQCGRCLVPTWSKRPDGETFGAHLPDCSLPQDHESYCVGGVGTEQKGSTGE